MVVCRRTLVILLILAVILGVSITCLATEPEIIDYHALFARAPEADNMEADILQDELADAFYKNQVEFVRALAQEDENVREAVAFLTVYAHYFTPEELPGLRDDLLAMKQDDTLPPEAQTVIDDFVAEISELEKDLGPSDESGEATPPVFDPADYAFDDDTIRKFIDGNLALENRHDEEFNRLLADAYQASPKLFAKMISGYPQEDVSYLVQCVASIYQKRGASAPNVDLAGVDAQIADILRMIQSEIDGSSENDSSPENHTSIPTDIVVAVLIGIAVLAAICVTVIVLRKRK